MSLQFAGLSCKVQATVTFHPDRALVTDLQTWVSRSSPSAMTRKSSKLVLKSYSRAKITDSNTTGTGLIGLTVSHNACAGELDERANVTELKLEYDWFWCNRNLCGN